MHELHHPGLTVTVRGSEIFTSARSKLAGTMMIYFDLKLATSCKTPVSKLYPSYNRSLQAQCVAYRRVCDIGSDGVIRPRHRVTSSPRIRRRPMA